MFVQHPEIQESILIPEKFICRITESDVLAGWNQSTSIDFSATVIYSAGERHSVIWACSLLCMQPSKLGAARYTQLMLLSFIDMGKVV